MGEKAQLQAVADEAAEETKRAARFKEITKENKDLGVENTELRGEVAKKDRQIAKLSDAPNKLHLGLAVTSGCAASYGGFKVNRVIREYTADWIDPQTSERTMGAKILADVVPPALGLGAAGVGFFVTSGGVSSSVLIGTGLGFAAGSMLSTLMVG